MKTVDIQNCTDFKDSMFKVFVNGEEHVMRNQFLNVQVSDDEPIRVKVKYSWDGSPVYTFNPKDNMLLRIQVNKQIANYRSTIWLLASFLLALVLGYFYGNGRFIAFLPSILLLLPLIHQTIKRKKYFIIQKVA